MGEISDEEVVSQARLAERFGFGRTPLREAVHLLEREGLVRSQPNHRLRIARLSLDDAEELLMMRILLEAVAVRATVPLLTTADLARLHGLIAQMQHYAKLGDLIGYRAPHRDFHLRLVDAAGPRVAAELEELLDHSARYFLRPGSSASWDVVNADHRAILDAASTGDGVVVADALALHYLNSFKLISAEVQTERVLTQLYGAIAIVAPSALDRPGAQMSPEASTRT
jgi:DNA-binding GntR family transcriptional regulator